MQILVGGNGSNAVIAAAAQGELVTLSLHSRQVCSYGCAEEGAHVEHMLLSGDIMTTGLLSSQGLSMAPRQDLIIAAPTPDDRLVSITCSASRLSTLWSDGSLRCYSVADMSTDAEDESDAAPALEMQLKGFCMPSRQQARKCLHDLHRCRVMLRRRQRSSVS